MPAWLRLALPVTPESTLEATGQELMDGRRTGQDRTGPDTVGLDRTGLDTVGQEMVGLDTVGLVMAWLGTVTPGMHPWFYPQATSPTPPQ